MSGNTAGYNFKDIISHFNIGEALCEVIPFGSGHINDTFLVRNNLDESEAYLLQKINSFVFKDVDGLMNNMVLVTGHLKKKILEASGDPEREVLTLIPASDKKYYYKDSQDNYWRMTFFLKGTKSFDIVSTGEQAYQGGVAFGRFQGLLADLDPGLLIDTIPNFLNIEKRLKDFNIAIAQDKAGRLKTVTEEVEFLKGWSAAMSDILKLGRAGLLPLRITHNDTKFNNILLDKDNRIQCVIDLDTVMPGYVAYDFGDAIRSIINTAAEDEKDLDAIQLNIPLFAQFTRGYLSNAKSFLTENELESLITGVLLLPYMQAVRFLTDYIEGDVYYKIHFPMHNLQRTSAQIQLFKMLVLNKDILDHIIHTEWQALK